MKRGSYLIYRIYLCRFTPYIKYEPYTYIYTLFRIKLWNSDREFRERYGIHREVKKNLLSILHKYFTITEEIFNITFTYFSFLVGGNGKIYEGAGWRVGAHTVGYNDKSISISFLGDFRGKYVIINIYFILYLFTKRSCIQVNELHILINKIKYNEL